MRVGGSEIEHAFLVCVSAKAVLEVVSSFKTSLRNISMSVCMEVEAGNKKGVVAAVLMSVST
jgi:hypothetical protein